MEDITLKQLFELIERYQKLLLNQPEVYYSQIAAKTSSIKAADKAKKIYSTFLWYTGKPFNKEESLHYIALTIIELIQVCNYLKLDSDKLYSEIESLVKKIEVSRDSEISYEKDYT